MARSALTDYLQVFPFWLFDATIVQGFNLPVFSPLVGFARISMPEITINMQEIEEGNWIFPSKVIKSGAISNITLERGATFFNSDFYRWAMAALLGDLSARRWFGNNNPTNQSLLPVIGGATARRMLVLVQFLTHGLGLAKLIPNGRDEAQLADTQASQGIGPFTTHPRVPAKAWMLHGCLPTRMKPGGDFDATSSDISMAEIEVSIEEIEEISLADELGDVLGR